MPDPTPPNKPLSKPFEPLRRIDWLAVAPWTLLLRAPGAVVGWPWLIAAVGAVFLTPFSSRVVIDQDLGEAAALHLVAPYGALVGTLGDLARVGLLGWLWLLFAVVGWTTLGCLIVDQATPAISGSPRRSIRDSLKRLPSALIRTLSALGLVLAAMTPFAIAMWLYGVLLDVPGLASLLVWLLPVVGVAFAIPFSLLLIVALFGTPLFIAAITIDDADAFDALSRTVAYLYQRLLILAGCLLVAAALGWLFATILEGVYRIALQSLSLLAIGSGTAAGEGVLSVMARVFAAIVHAFLPAYFFTAGVAVYLVMRQAVDGQPLDETAQSADAA